jgi:hypothetical protein
MKVIFVLLLIFNNVIKAQTVKVVGIADGDTFTALFADNHTERIRLKLNSCNSILLTFCIRSEIPKHPEETLHNS